MNDSVTWIADLEGRICGRVGRMDGCLEFVMRGMNGWMDGMLGENEETGG